jgi:hypothetical protein
VKFTVRVRRGHVQCVAQARVVSHGVSDQVWRVEDFVRHMVLGS